MSKADILVDIDFKPENKRRLIKMAEDFAWKMYFVSESLGLRFADISVYETNKGLHFYLKAESERPLTPLEIIIIQLALGSDYKREVFNLRRARAWLNGEELDNSWNTLFKHKYKNGKLVSCERRTEYSKVLEGYIVSRYKKLAGGD